MLMFSLEMVFFLYSDTIFFALCYQGKASPYTEFPSSVICVCKFPAYSPPLPFFFFFFPSFVTS